MLGLFKVFRFGGFADPIGSVKPAAKVHVLAARAAEGTKGRIFIAGDGNAPVTGWTLERRHGYARRSTRITNYELQITNYKLQITNYKLQKRESGAPTFRNL